MTAQRKRKASSHGSGKHGDAASALLSFLIKRKTPQVLLLHPPKMLLPEGFSSQLAPPSFAFAPPNPATASQGNFKVATKAPLRMSLNCGGAKVMQRCSSWIPVSEGGTSLCLSRSLGADRYSGVVAFR